MDLEDLAAPVPPAPLQVVERVISYFPAVEVGHVQAVEVGHTLVVQFEYRLSAEARRNSAVVSARNLAAAVARMLAVAVVVRKLAAGVQHKLVAGFAVAASAAALEVARLSSAFLGWYQAKMDRRRRDEVVEETMKDR